MPRPSVPAITPFAADSVDAALATLCCRFGHAEQEADRRGRIRALVRSSRALAQALDAFVRNAAPHAQGIHCAGDMQRDAEALTQALADWTFSVEASADVHRTAIRALATGVIERSHHSAVISDAIA